MKVKVLYEDKDILVIDKPVGILVHPDERSKDKTILDFFSKKYSEMKVVHRLDKETSGVLILAKNEKAHEFLKKQFQNRTIKKNYLALAEGEFKKDRGVINKPIGRSPVDFRRRLAGRGARGEMREAITEYKVLKRFKNFTFLEISPKTGRTHQIRVHLKFMNRPILCDALYNPKGLCPKELGRMALHALAIEFRNLEGKVIKVESKIPREFKNYLSRF